MRAWWIMLVALGATGCGSKAAKQQRAQYEENARHYTPPTVMSRVGFGSIVERRFRALDRNGDNYIDKTELPHPDTRGIASLDKDGDGKVSGEEFSRGMLARFDANDLNHDGTVTSDEFRTAMQRRQAARPPA